MYDLALEKNKNGVYYPIFGICLGMELLAQVAIGGEEIRAHCSASKLSLPLEFLEGRVVRFHFRRSDRGYINTKH